MFLKIIVFSLFVAVSFSSILPLSKTEDKTKKIYEYCSAEYNITKDMLPNINKEIKATNLHNLKCFFHCLKWTGNGLVTNRTLNMTILNEWIKNNTKPSELPVLQRSIEQCRNEVPKSLPICDYVDIFVGCLKRTLKFDKIFHYDNMYRAVDICTAQYNVTLEQFQSYTSNPEANKTTSPNIKCFLNCLLTQNGMITNGHLEVNKIKEMQARFSDPKDLEEIHDSFEKCLSETQNTQSECDYVDQIVRCVHRKRHGKESGDRLENNLSTTESQAKN